MKYLILGLVLIPSIAFAELNLPDKIFIGPYKVTIIFQDDLVEVEDAVGISDESTMEIFLQTPNDDYSEQLICWAYWHEQFHFILSAMGETELNDDEEFVDEVGEYLAQANGC